MRARLGPKMDPEEGQGSPVDNPAAFLSARDGPGTFVRSAIEQTCRHGNIIALIDATLATQVEAANSATITI